MTSCKKLFDLAKKSQSKIIVADQNGEPICVLLPIEDYELLVENGGEVRGLTEGQLLAKINRDIAIWREAKEDQEAVDLAPDLADYSKEALGNDDFSLSLDNISEIKKEEKNEEDQYYFEPVE